MFEQKPVVCRLKTRGMPNGHRRSKFSDVGERNPTTARLEPGGFGSAVGCQLCNRKSLGEWAIHAVETRQGTV